MTLSALGRPAQLPLRSLLMMMTLAIMIVALQLVPLHQVDGRIILVNPSEITAVATPRRGDQRLGAPGTACMVFLSDGTHWQVLETCATIKQLIEK